MKTHIMLLLVLATIIIAISHRASGATLLWTNTLPVNATLTDLMPDGKGGVVICYSLVTSAYIRYLDKNGVKLWESIFSSASEAYADYISKKQVIVVVFQSGQFAAWQFELKTGNSQPIASAAGSDFTFGPAVPTANKDAKGFFLFQRVTATNARVIQRYSYK